MGKSALYEGVKRRILTLDLEPGADLDETALAQEYQLSRTPLREVFRQLAGEGYLDLRSNRGARVSEMSPKTLHDFFLVAPMIYAAVGKLAVQNATTKQLEILQEIQKKFRTALEAGESQTAILENDHFHSQMGNMAGNLYLMPSLRRVLIDHARISQVFFQADSFAGDRMVAADHHDYFIKAIESGSEKLAADTSVAHWELSQRQIEKFIMPTGLNFELSDPVSTVD